MEARDKLGQIIEPGDVLAYGVRRGNTGGLHFYEVLEVQPLKKQRYGETHSASAVQLVNNGPWQEDGLAPKQWIRNSRKTRLKQLRTQAVKLPMVGLSTDPETKQVTFQWWQFRKDEPCRKP